MTNVVKLREVNGVVYANSLDFARDFTNGRHDNALRLVNRVRERCSSNVRGMWFRDDVYFDGRNNKQPCIDMTRQGWSLVAMNIEGMIDWKVAYILKFDEMEAKLGAGARTEGLFDRSPKENVVAFQGPPRPQGDLFDASKPKPTLSEMQNPYATLGAMNEDEWD